VSAPAFPDRAADWLTVPDALARILAHPPETRVELVPLGEALGRVLAADLRAAATLPPWDNAAMDGYAVRSEDLPEEEGAYPVALPVAGEVRAGDPRGDAPPPGSALRIMTGAPVPAGVDGVIRVEDTDGEQAEAGRIRILGPRDRGRNIRPGGQDMREGDLLLPAGAVVTPGRVALLAAAGADPVPVVQRPVVAIVPTGDELCPPAAFPASAAGRYIPESNGPMLVAACAAAGLPTLLLPPVRDEGAALRSALEGARADADVVITLGGASMGTADLVKEVLEELGFQLDFWRVRMRPGGPFSFGTLPGAEGEGRIPVFGLPGNPASAFVTFQLLVRPFLLASSGHENIHRPVVPAIAGASLSAPADRAVFPRVTLTLDDAGGVVADPAGPQSSGLVGSLGRAQGLAVVPGGRRIPAGGEVEVILLDDEPSGSPSAGYTEALASGVGDATPGGREGAIGGGEGAPE
jgi:molybdopterin molybdotransferase